MSAIEPLPEESRGPELVDDREAIKRARGHMVGLGAAYFGAANVAMQLARPEVGYGVVESKVEGGRGDLHPIKRARTTSTFLAVALIGSSEDRAGYREAINRQHVQVRSTEESPVKYNAFDPQLQLWVAACLYYGLADSAERMIRLDDEARDILYQHGARLGTTLQVRPEMWPEDRVAFVAYWRQQVAQIRVDPPVRDFVVSTMKLGPFPWILRVIGGGFHYFMNVGSLPPEFRAAYGLTWTGKQQRWYDRVIKVSSLGMRVLPPALRIAPLYVLLWEMRLRKRLGMRLM